MDVNRRPIPYQERGQAVRGLLPGGGARSRAPLRARPRLRPPDVSQAATNDRSRWARSLRGHFLQRWVRVSRGFDGDDHEHHPGRLKGPQPERFEEIVDHDEEGNRKQKPRPPVVALRHPPDGMQRRNEEYDEEGKADVTQFEYRIIVTVMGIRHQLDPAGSVDDARRVRSHQPEALVSPSHKGAMLDLGDREIPYGRTAREAGISGQHIGDTLGIEADQVEEHNPAEGDRYDDDRLGNAERPSDDQG